MFRFVFLGNDYGNDLTASSHLPPRGIFVPTHIIFHPELPSAVLVTWIKLRCLAWDGWGTPPLSISELASLVGIHPARLYRQLSQLQDISALSWRNDKNGKITLSFLQEKFDKPTYRSDMPDSPHPMTLDSKYPGLPAPASYIPTRILGYLSFEDDQEVFTGDDSSDELGSESSEGRHELLKSKECIFNQR